jgi:ParB-like chromosome segregation protein Spo0J
MRISIDPTSDQRQPSTAERQYHPAAALFPLLPVDSPEFGELVADIGEHGLLQPIVLHEGRILDGRNRYRACQHAGVEPRIVRTRDAA